MKQHLDTKYTCDGENCKQEAITNDGKYPYGNGWAFLYNINFKTDHKNIHEYKDKHFCCPKCMMGFIKKAVEASLNR